MKFVEKVAYYSSPQGKLRLFLQLPNLIRLYLRVFRDPRVSLFPKAILVAGILYFILPIKLIPDLPPNVFGVTADLLVLIFALKIFITLAPRSVVEEHVRLLDGRAGQDNSEQDRAGED
jgi:uncharacterized membrane protein YkvA (DUF1232 family)